MRKHLLIPGIILICFLLSILTYIIPPKGINDNIRQTADEFAILESNTLYPQVYAGRDESMQDCFTDSIMIRITTYNDDSSALKKAMESKYLNNGEVKKSLLQNNENNIKDNVKSYARYWHGYTFVLKFLLNFFSYMEIKMLNAAIQLLLFSSVIYCFIKNNLKRYLIPFIISFLFMMPVVMSMALQFSTSTYIALLAMLLVLKYRGKIKNSIGYARFFVVTGILTNYFDLLTFPLITLGFPLILVYITEETSDYRMGIKLMSVCCAGWLAGYAGMWMLKWVLASVITDRNVVENAVKEVLFRSSAVSESKIAVSRIGTVLKNISAAFGSVNILCTVLGAIFCLLKKQGINKNDMNGRRLISDLVVFLLIAAMPFVWYFVLTNHSYTHYWFTFRILSVTVFAVLSFMISLNRILDF